MKRLQLGNKSLMELSVKTSLDNFSEGDFNIRFSYKMPIANNYLKLKSYYYRLNASDSDLLSFDVCMESTLQHDTVWLITQIEMIAFSGTITEIDNFEEICEINDKLWHVNFMIDNIFSPNDIYFDVEQPFNLAIHGKDLKIELFSDQVSYSLRVATNVIYSFNSNDELCAIYYMNIGTEHKERLCKAHK